MFSLQNPGKNQLNYKIQMIYSAIIQTPIVNKYIITYLFLYQLKIKVNQLDRICKRVFRDKANIETKQKEIKTYKVFPESYKLKIRKILRNEEKTGNAEEDLEEKEDMKRIELLQEQKVIV